MNTIALKTPLSPESILKLKVGDKVLLSGTIFTARDKAHQYLVKSDFKKIKNSVIFHCGPLIKNKKILGAGPTTSGRMNIYTPAVIKKYGIKAIIGKGGMDDSVKNALKGKAVYFSAIGGSAVLYAEKLKIKNVYQEEFGDTEAIWELEAKNFPLVVTMDAHGGSLHENIYKASEKIFKRLISK